MTRTSNSPLADAVARMRRWLFGVALFSLAINLLTLTVPLHMLHVYDNVLTSRSGVTLLFLTILAMGLLAALGLLEMFRSRILVRIGARFDHDLANTLFAAAVAERLGGKAENPGQPLRDLDTFRNFIGGSALPVLFDAPWAPVFIAVTFLLHPWLGFIALGGAAILLVIAIANEISTRRLTQAANVETLAATGFADSALRNAEVIAAMGMAPAIAGRWRQRHGAAAGGHARIADRSGNFVAMAKFLRPALQVGMLSAGAWLAIEHVITPGVMIAGSIIMARALAPVEGAIGSWRSLVVARSAYARLRETLKRRPAAPERMRLPDPRGETLVSSIYVAPPRAVKPVLKGVSFSLSPGEMLGVIGPSASGKSTLARSLVGVWPLLSGEIRLDGAALADLDRVQVGRCIGYLPQDIELFDGTVAENIARFNEPDSDEVLEAARLAGVHDMILRLPQGYDTLIGPGGEALSGGQRQRIAFARAVYGRPALLILDEPNANLDGDGEDALVNSIATLRKQGSAIVVIAHRPSLLAAADNILVLRDGMVDAFGPRAEVFSRFTRPFPSVREGSAVVATIGPRS